MSRLVIPTRTREPLVPVGNTNGTKWRSSRRRLFRLHPKQSCHLVLSTLLSTMQSFLSSSLLSIRRELPLPFPLYSPITGSEERQWGKGRTSGGRRARRGWKQGSGGRSQGGWQQAGEWRAGGGGAAAGGRRLAGRRAQRGAQFFF